MSVVTATPPHPLAERFAGIIAMMVGMLGARLERPGKPGLAGPLTFAIHIRLQRIRNRLARYVARWQAGTLAPPRPRTRPAAPRPPRTKPGQWDHLPKLPRERMWLTRLVPGIIVGASHLNILLDDPDMQAMMQVAPQIGRTLRPLWHMLSPDPLPPLLRPPRSAPAAPVTGSGRAGGNRDGARPPAPGPLRTPPSEATPHHPFRPSTPERAGPGPGPPDLETA